MMAKQFLIKKEIVDFMLFLKFKNIVKDKHFQDIANIQRNVTNSILTYGL